MAPFLHVVNRLVIQFQLSVPLGFGSLSTKHNLLEREVLFMRALQAENLDEIVQTCYVYI